MKKILILGAGLSATSLISYLLEISEEHEWEVTVADCVLAMAQKKVGNNKNGRAIEFNVNDEKQRSDEISRADLVVSMLPASMHPIVAKCCVSFNKHMVTASYVSDEVKALDKEAKEKGLILLNEVGVDPGIDHMSTMQVIDRIKAQGGDMISFRSYTGGLVAPKYDNNPWSYKFTWNPRNVVLAGQGVAQLIVNGKYKYIPYNQLFKRTVRAHILDVGEFEGYPNRDSLKYRKIYGLDNIPTMLRGTLRRPGFCKSWDIFVQLGMTDDTYTLENSENMTYRDFINTYLRYEENIFVENKLCSYLDINPDSYSIYLLRWLGVFSEKKVELKNATPAQILQKLLEEKWALDKEDKDMIVMQHKFGYVQDGEEKEITSSMVFIGKDNENTAMSLTVGLPAAIAVKLIMTGKITTPGVHIPVTKDIYEPILEELKELGIEFIEE